MTLKLVALVQARMGSTRLPGKVLAEIAGKPMLWHVANRVSAAKGVNQVCVVTSENSSDNAIEEVCKKFGLKCFRGSEDDVLDRFYRAASALDATAVARITADCPLIDPAVISDVVATFGQAKYDYVSNILKYTYPDGLDVEVFSFDWVEKAWKEASLSGDREHVTPFMRRSRTARLGNVEAKKDLSHLQLRWTVDTKRDLDFVREVYARLDPVEGKLFGYESVLSLLEREPKLMEMNAGEIRNEGYYKTILSDPAVPARKRSIERSLAMKKTAEKLIPSCTQTFSKGPTQFVQGVAPVFLQKGQGSRVWDVDGNEYIDYPMGLGPIILGHNYPAVTEAVIKQMREGTAFSLPHPLEVEVAELLTEIIPCAEMVRFGKNGSDVTSGAVRVARAYTGREMIACSGYHGWQDWYIGTTTRDRGIPESTKKLTRTFQYNDIASLEAIFAENPGKVAAVIMEPVGVIAPKDGFLEKVQSLARKEGALLIFDEVVTGFRYALGGAQELLKVVPDLACFGKAMGNGLPIAAVVGRKDVMALFDEIFFSFTAGGETASLAAARATILELRAKNAIGHFWEMGQQIKDGYNTYAKAFGVEKFTECVGYAPRVLATFKDERGAESLELKSLFQQECLKRGVLFAGAHNICLSHGPEEIHWTLRVYRTAMEILAEAIKKGNVKERLEGEPVQPVFRRP